MIDSSHMTLTDLELNSVFDKLGLSYRGTFTLREIIGGVKKTGLEIASVIGIAFPNGVDILNPEIASSSFKKKFYSNLFFQTDQEKDNFKKIIDNLDNSYILNELQILSGDILDPNTGLEIGKKSQIRIIGNTSLVDEKITVIVIRAPY
jgi:hypothetical protein